MGSCCSKKNHESRHHNNDSSTNDAANDAIFMKSKLEKFKQSIYDPENGGKKKKIEELKLSREEDLNNQLERSDSKKTSEVDEKSQKLIQNQIEELSDLTPPQKSDSYSDFKNMNDISGTLESQFSKSHSNSKINEIFTLQDPGQYKKGKIISKGGNKAIYQCMHKSTGKLLIAKTYFVIFLRNFFRIFFKFFFKQLFCKLLLR